MSPTQPNELISSIFELAIPPVSFGTQSERTSLLKTIALLSRDWVPFAQRHLYTTILVSPALFHFEAPNRSASRLVAVLQAKPELARLVRTIRFRKARGKRGPLRADALLLEMPKLLEVCLDVEVIAVSEVGLVDLRWMAHLHRLNSLTLHETSIDNPTILSALTWLELSAQYPGRAFRSLPFDPTLFPSLRDLRIHRCSPLDFSDSLPTLDALYLSELDSPPLAWAVWGMTVIWPPAISIPILWDRSIPANLWRLVGAGVRKRSRSRQEGPSGRPPPPRGPQGGGAGRVLVACGKWEVEVVFEDQGEAPLVSARFREICRAARVERDGGKR